MALRRPTTSAPLLILLVGYCAVAACASLSDSITVKNGPEGTVILERVPSRGTTVRYSGQLKSFRASHPVSFSPAVLERALSGIQVGIAPADRDGKTQGIRPTPLFSPKEAAFLAPEIAAALERAEPDQRVKFQIGAESDRTDGTLYVETRTIQFALSHFHSPAQRRDESLSIYILSLRPEEAQADTSGTHHWMEAERDEPRLAINYAALETLFPADAHAPLSSRSAEQAPTTGSGDMRNMKDVVDRQAKELESLKSELEALKKQIRNQGTSPQSKPIP